MREIAIPRDAAAASLAAPATPLVLVSHVLCPYVQRAAIVLAEKGVPFERRDVDLACRPDWFLEISPLGKTPVLVAHGEAIFESSVICEYLDEITLPRLHPADALTRARHRAWIAFGSQVLSDIGAYYNAPDEAALRLRERDLRRRFEALEAELGPGPWFGGTAFGLVDAVFGPVFRYFDVFDPVADHGFWSGLPKVCAWRAALAARASVRNAVLADYPARLREFVRARAGALARRLDARSTGTPAARTGLSAGCAPCANPLRPVAA